MNPSSPSRFGPGGRPPAWLFLALLLAAPLAGSEKGSFGFRLDVKLGGPKSSSIISFRIGSAVVKSVTPDSPAAAAKISAEDELIEVDGMAVPGCKGLQLKAKLTPPPGKAVPMKFKRPNGEVYEVVLSTAPPKT